MVFAASAYSAGGGGEVEQGGDGGIKAEEVWFTQNMQNHHGGMIVIDGALYGANGGNGVDTWFVSTLRPERYSGTSAIPTSVAYEKVP